jgi:hypothetical protein
MALITINQGNMLMAPRAGLFNSNVKCSWFRPVLLTGRLEVSKAVSV